MIINLWENACKYSHQESGSSPIIFDAVKTPSGGLLFSMTNDSKVYSEQQLKELTKMDIRHYDKKIKGSLNKGFGLFLAEKTCKHGNY